jgi:hypothetical protein
MSLTSYAQSRQYRGQKQKELVAVIHHIVLLEIGFLE